MLCTGEVCVVAAAAEPVGAGVLHRPQTQHPTDARGRMTPDRGMCVRRPDLQPSRHDGEIQRADPNPLSRQDAAVLIGILSVLEGEFYDPSNAHLASRIAACFRREGLLEGSKGATCPASAQRPEPSRAVRGRRDERAASQSPRSLMRTGLQRRSEHPSAACESASQALAGVLQGGSRRYGAGSAGRCRFRADCRR